MMNRYGWLGVGVLVLMLGWDGPQAQAQLTTGTYSPATLNLSQTGAQRSPSLTANYYGLMRGQAGAAKSRTTRERQRQAQLRALMRQLLNAQTAMANIPGFMTANQFFNTNGIQVPKVQAQRPHRRR
jgi:hypothetical protein